MKKLERLQTAKSYYPEAYMELNHNNHFQMLVAVMLSAQTTDKMVNKATKNLFNKYYEAKEFKELSFTEIYEHIKIVGFAKTKTKHLMELSKIVDEKYEGKVVNNRELLMELPGVGQKTANVVLANIYDEPYIAVDTHVERVAKRLYISKQSATVKEVEKDLTRILKDENMNQYHHSLIFFGRYHCKAQRPECDSCNLQEECRYYKHLKK